MDTQMIIRAIDNLPPATRDELLGRISQMVVVALAGGEARVNGRGRDRATRQTARSTSAATASAEDILAYIKANPDQRTEEIAAGLGSDVKPVLKKLREAKQVRTKGQKRSMTYSVAGGGKS